MLARLRRLVAATAGAPAAPALALLLGLLFLFQPAQVFEANQPFFHYGLLQAAGPLLLLFLASFAVATRLSTLGSAPWRRLVAAAVAGVAIAAWINATFLSATSGTLDGRAPLLLTDPARVRLNALHYAAFALTAAACAYRWETVARRFLWAFFGVLLAHAGWIALADDHPWRRAGALQRLAEFSPEKNLLVIVLDSFQADFFEQILEREPPLRQALDGFTYYPNAVGVAPTTYLAIPALHSGRHDSPGEDLRRAYQSRVVQGSFVARHARAGYEAMLVNPVLNYCPAGAECASAEELVQGRARQVLGGAALLLGLSVFRTAPDACKPAIYAWGFWAIQRLFLELDRVRASNAVLDLMARAMRASAGRPTVKFLHLFSTHPPISVDGDCAPVSGRPWAPEHAVEQDRCAVSRIVAFLQALEAGGLYDRTAIAIVADHGAGLPRDRGSDWTWGAFASPVLLLKPFDARGRLADSPRLVGLSDLPSILCAWTRACDPDGGPARAAAPADRPPAYPFYAYTWRHEYWFSGSVPIDDAFEIRGPPRELASWWRTSRHPASPVRELFFTRNDPPEVYGFGWSAHESRGAQGWRWALGREADLYLKVEPRREARLALQLTTHPGNSGQTMTVLVNGTPVADGLPVSVAGNRHEVLVPADLVGEGQLRVLFRFSKWNPPGPADGRALAVLFSRLWVR